MAKLSVTMFPAKNGDCFLISIGESSKKHILIDSGYTQTYNLHLKKVLCSLAENGEQLSLFVITHVDQDHLLGAITFLSDNNTNRFIDITEIWYNSYRHLQFSKEKTKQIGRFERKALEEEVALGSSFISGAEENLSDSDISVKQGSTLASLIYEGGYNWNKSFNGKAVSININTFVQIEGIKIWLLSPDEEKLQNLSNEWLSQLHSHKFNFKLSDEEIFDDAFEFYMLRKVEMAPDDVDISLCDGAGLDIDQFINKEQNAVDASTQNGSSIALFIEQDDKKLLFLGDAHPDIILSSLRGIKAQGVNTDHFDLVKLPHHGSAKNITPELAALLNADRYLISTNGDIHQHPDFEAMARIILAQPNEPKKFIFNYSTEIAQLLMNEKWMKKYRYTLHIGDGTRPLVIEL